jgi:hypothetical protein
VTGGSGEFLARRIVEHSPLRYMTVVSLGERLGRDLSTAACAYALAVLASERGLE